MIVVLRKGQYTAPTSILKDDLVWLTLEPWVSLPTKLSVKAGAFEFTA